MIQKGLDLGRVQLKLDFESAIDLREAIGERIAEKANEKGISYKEFVKKHPRIIENIRKELVGSRGKAAGDKTALFYTRLYSALFGGDMNGLAPGDCHKGFHPDVTRRERGGFLRTEVKATSTKNGSPKVGCFQFVNYCKDFLFAFRNREKPSVEYAFFKYGKGNTNEKLYQYNNRRLVEKLAHSTRDLLVVPLNLLILMLRDYDVKNMDHSSSNTSRDLEPYWRPHGGQMTRIHNSEEELEKLVEGLKYSRIGNGELCTDELVRDQCESPDNIYCKGFKIKPFTITRYYNKNMLRWAESFNENFESFMDVLGISGALDDMVEEEAPF